MNIFLIIILTIIAFEFILELILNILDIKNLKTDLPDEFRDIYDNERYTKSQNYTKENIKFSITTSLITITPTILFIILGGFNYIDEIARSFNYGTIATGLIFIGILTLLMSIMNIPFSIYSTFVIEEKYGFNKTTVKTYIMDMVKGLILTIVLGAPILSVIIWFFESTGTNAWIYSWGGVVLFTIIIQFIAPVIIFPLFNKFNPIEEGDLKDGINSYAEKERFKMKGVFTMDGSKRSTKLNAFFTGFGKNRRIVLFDTLIEKLTTGEIISVLAHEMGHFKLKHIIKSIVISIVTMGVMFYVLSIFMNNETLFAAFKMKNLSVYASLIFFAFLYSPINMILSIGGNILSRHHEYEADSYSAKTAGSENMISALKKLTIENLSNLSPHPLNVFLNYSHPPVLERIKAISKI